MKIFYRRKISKAVKLVLFTSLLATTQSVLSKNYIYSADGRAIPIKSGVTQPDLSAYRSPIESKVMDRRFYTNEATFLANEQFKWGMEGWNDMVKAAMPVAYRRAFQWVVMRENYMYARNLLDYIGGRSHSGVHMVQGPYWTMKANRHTAFNRLQRDRGERTFSNKDVLLGFYLPMVYQRTGFPRVFDDIQVSYLQYKSVDTRFTGVLDTSDSFDDPITGKVGGWGVDNTYFNDYTQRFDHDKMDTTFDMGGLGQFLKRRSQWADRFYQSDRFDEIEGSRDTVHLLGNDAEEGMRGWGLAMASVNVMLKVKSAMFTDGDKLMGINPETYNPKNGLKYIPHEITPNLLWVGDLPERLWSMDLKDASSQLWDQASWLWGTSAFSVLVHRRDQLFTSNPPVDGGLIEKATGKMASALSATVFKNVKAMHTKKGILVSQWTPDKKTGNSFSMKDMAMMMAALHDLEQTWNVIGEYESLRKDVLSMIKMNADLLLRVQKSDGHFNSQYSVTGQGEGNEKLSASNWEGARALISAYYSTDDKRYLKAARKAFNYNNKNFWVEAQGVYRTELDNDSVEVTPYAVGIALGAIREVLLTTPAHMVNAQIERYTRFWIQTVNQSGLMQAETKFTGEIYTGFASGDDDADGIPVVTKGFGENGSGPLMAGRVVINVGGKANNDFMELNAPLHNGDKFAKVVMRYEAKSMTEQQEIMIPDNIQRTAAFVDRKPMVREDGTTIPLQAAIPNQVALGIKHKLSGKQIFEANCQICHGQHGEGIDGKNLVNMMNFPPETMFDVVQHGRFERSMPPWGIGNDDGFGGTLQKSEIDLIINYVQSDIFRTNHKQATSGKIVKGQLPKDVWHYLSRDNLKTNGQMIAGQKEADVYIRLQQNPQKIKASWWENIGATNAGPMNTAAVKGDDLAVK